MVLSSGYGQSTMYLSIQQHNRYKDRHRGIVLCPKDTNLTRGADLCALSYLVPGLLTVKLDNIATLYSSTSLSHQKSLIAGYDLSVLLSKSLRKSSPQPCQNCDAIGGKSWTRATPFQDVWVPIAGCRPSTVMTEGA